MVVTLPVIANWLAPSGLVSPPFEPLSAAIAAWLIGGLLATACGLLALLARPHEILRKPAIVAPSQRRPAKRRGWRKPMATPSSVH